MQPQLLSVKVKIDKENQSITLLASLLESYNTMVTMILIRKTIFFVDEISSTLLKPKKILSNQVIHLILKW